jgi:hypothetical protein
MLKSIIALVLLVLGACAGINHLPEGDSPGAQLVREKCTMCHGQPHPTRHTAPEWGHYIVLMETHMETKGIAFSSEEKKIVLDYLQRNASK